MSADNDHTALADALDCFWNASLGSAKRDQDITAIAVASALSEGFSAMAARLREHAPPKGEEMGIAAEGKALAVTFAKRLEANAAHAEQMKFTVANLSTLKVGECRDLARILRAASSAAPGAPAAFQSRVAPWMQECFGAEASADRLERGDRLLEEVLELLQSGDYPPARVAALTAYVWGRPAGEPRQEVGGVMVTLAAYCLAHGLDMHEAAEIELARISVPEVVAKIRAKQAAKPKGSALPIAAPEAPARVHEPAETSRAKAAAIKAVYLFADAVKREVGLRACSPARERAEQAAIDAISSLAALITAPQAAVRVKPLEWRCLNGDKHQIAHSLLSTYVVVQDEFSCQWWTREGAGKAVRAETVDAAKAAAQADYEARILSALEPAPDLSAIRAEAPARTYEDGVRAAAQVIDARIAEYISDHGTYDPRCGAKNADTESVFMMRELSAAIRSHKEGK